MKSDVERIRNELAGEYLRAKFDRPEPDMVELVGVSFFADESTIFSEPDLDWIRREREWYMSHSLNVNMIGGKVPKIWREIADKDGAINSNYGYLLFSGANGFQFHHVVKALRRNPDTRRAVAVYTRPTIHSEAEWCGMNDFICTNAVQYFIRQNRLDAVVQMRSNDAVFGYKNDLAWQRYILGRVAGEFANVEPGAIKWQVGSLHVYPRHYKFIRRYLNRRAN